MNRAQRIVEKDGISCVFIMFTPEIVVMKNKNCSFLYYLLVTAKKEFGERFKSI